MTALVIIDGDNVNRTLQRLNRYIDYLKLLEIVTEVTNHDDLEAHLFITIPKGRRQMTLAIEECDELKGRGIQIHDWFDGHGGYPDQVIIDFVHERQASYPCDTIMMVTADRDFAELLREEYEAHHRVIAISPQQVRWPDFVVRSNIPALAKAYPDLLHHSPLVHSHRAAG